MVAVERGIAFIFQNCTTCSSVFRAVRGDHSNDMNYEITPITVYELKITSPMQVMSLATIFHNKTETDIVYKRYKTAVGRTR